MACRRLRDPITEAASAQVILHGDPHPGNVVITATGPVLVDFDLAGTGPAMWDLTNPVVQHRRFGLPARQLATFLRAYGSNPYRQPGFEALVRLQELLCVSYVLERLLTGAPAGPELEMRLATPATGRPGRWYPLLPVHAPASL
jgi:Ser/Thr protein kinase RdoA (MazF antagonist)